MTLAAGKSIRWVAEQLGHANPEFTMRTYAHAMAIEEADLSFADFGDPKRPIRPLSPKTTPQAKTPPA